MRLVNMMTQQVSWSHTILQKSWVVLARGPCVAMYAHLALKPCQQGVNREGVNARLGTHINVVGIDVVCEVGVLRCGQDHPGVVICGGGGVGGGRGMKSRQWTELHDSQQLILAYLFLGTLAGREHWM